MTDRRSSRKQAGEAARDASASTTSQKLSRRALIHGAGVAAASAVVAAGLAGLAPRPVRATSGTMVYGALNSSGSDSTALTSVNQDGTLSVQNFSSTVGSGGAVALRAGSDLGRAIDAASGGDLAAVTARADGGGNAVEGIKASTTGHAIAGFQNSTGSTWAAVAGSTLGAGPGVYGRGDGTGHGVQGETFASAGAGVYGAALVKSAYAFHGNGRVRFDKVSGIAVMAAGTKSKTINPGTNVTAGSFVLLTPMADMGSRRLWFTRDATNDRFTIHLSSSRSKSTSIAWLLLN